MTIIASSFQKVSVLFHRKEFFTADKYVVDSRLFARARRSSGTCQLEKASLPHGTQKMRNLGLYRYVTRTNVSFFDPSPNLVFRLKNGTFVRVT